MIVVPSLAHTGPTTVLKADEEREGVPPVLKMIFTDPSMIKFSIMIIADFRGAGSRPGATA